MPLRLKHKIVVQVTADTAQKQKRFFLDDDPVQETDVSSFAHQANSELSIDDTVTEALSFGDVQDARGIYIETDKPCDVFINGSATPIPMILAPASGSSSGAAKAKLFLEATITQVSITNTVGDNSVLTGVYELWGDPV